MVQAHTRSSVLSGSPLQSLSVARVQLRGAGPTESTQAPKALDFLSALASQVCVPAWQVPMLSKPGCAPHGWVVPTTHAQAPPPVLSGEPSQLLPRVEVQSSAFA